MSDEIDFTRKGVWQGIRRGLPLAISAFASGLAFGVLARQAGLTLLDTALMSTLVAAGASQFVALGLWVLPLPIVGIIVTTFIVNLRHMLMGVALGRWFARLEPVKKYGAAHFMSDESWALTIGSLSSGERDAAILVGSGTVLYLGWISAGITGHLLGSVVGNPAAWGLDFAFPAVCIALLIGMWKGRSTLLPWIVAALVAIVAAHWLPGKWYILLGGLAGSLVGAFYGSA